MEKRGKNLKKATVLLIFFTICLSTLIVAGSSIDKNNTLYIDRAGNTLVADSLNHRVLEVDSSGTTVWTYVMGLNEPMDVERLSNGNTLICDTWNDRIIEVDSSGTIVWSLTAGLLRVFDGEKLSNGNILITDNNHNRVLEYDPSAGITVWEITGLNHPTDAERLSNGNTLITDCVNDRIIEVDSSNTIVWSYSTGLNHPTDAERLSNGNTLIAGNNNNNVIEINNAGTIVWSYSTGLDHPHDVERLSNGNTLIADVNNNRIIEVNPSGTLVWTYSGGLYWPFDTERLVNNPPNNPTITGQTNGEIGKTYEYTFSATDPDGDDIAYYLILWDDDTHTNLTGPFASGEQVTASHKWARTGTYTILARATDVYGKDSYWGTLDVSIPRSKNSYHHPFPSLLSRFTQLFPILRLLLQRLG